MASFSRPAAINVVPATAASVAAAADSEQSTPRGARSRRPRRASSTNLTVIPSKDPIGDPTIDGPRLIEAVRQSLPVSDIVKLCTEAAIGYTDRMSASALHFASWMGNIDAIPALVSAGVFADGRDRNYGRTPLLWACANGNSACALALIDLGASIKLTDSLGRGPVELATWSGNRGTADLVAAAITRIGQRLARAGTADARATSPQHDHQDRWRNPKSAASPPPTPLSPKVANTDSSRREITIAAQLRQAVSSVAHKDDMPFEDLADVLIDCMDAVDSDAVTASDTEAVKECLESVPQAALQGVLELRNAVKSVTNSELHNRDGTLLRAQKQVADAHARIQFKKTKVDAVKRAGEMKRSRLDDTHTQIKWLTKQLEDLNSTARDLQSQLEEDLEQHAEVVRDLEAAKQRAKIKQKSVSDSRNKKNSWSAFASSVAKLFIPYQQQWDSTHAKLERNGFADWTQVDLVIVLGLLGLSNHEGVLESCGLLDPSLFGTLTRETLLRHTVDMGQSTPVLVMAFGDAELLLAAVASINEGLGIPDCSGDPKKPRSWSSGMVYKHFNTLAGLESISNMLQAEAVGGEALFQLASAERTERHVLALCRKHALTMNGWQAMCAESNKLQQDDYINMTFSFSGFTPEAAVYAKFEKSVAKSRRGSVATTSAERNKLPSPAARISSLGETNKRSPLMPSRQLHGSDRDRTIAEMRRLSLP